MTTREIFLKQKKRKSYQHGITDCEGTTLPWMSGNPKGVFFHCIFVDAQYFDILLKSFSFSPFDQHLSFFMFHLVLLGFQLIGWLDGWLIGQGLGFLGFFLMGFFGGFGFLLGCWFFWPKKTYFFVSEQGLLGCFKRDTFQAEKCIKK